MVTGLERNVAEPVEARGCTTSVLLFCTCRWPYFENETFKIPQAYRCFSCWSDVLLLGFLVVM